MIKKILTLLTTTALCTTAFATSPIYSPYKDTSINMNWNNYVISTLINGESFPVPFLGTLQTDNHTVSLAFATGQCGSETWGGVSGEDLATNNLALFEANKTQYIVSTGGAAGAFQCSSVDDMRTFLNRYHYTSPYFNGLDFDIEGGYNEQQLIDLMNVTAELQKEKNFRVSLTLATTATSNSTLNSLGIWAINAANQAGLHYNINLMVMDFGASGCQTKTDGTCDMAASAEFAAEEVSKMYNIPLSQIELTPMIGGNDVSDEITTLSDMQKIALYVKDNNLAGLHYWSFDRDTPCNTTTKWASATCNNESTKPQAFNEAVLSVLEAK